MLINLRDYATRYPKARDIRYFEDYQIVLPSAGLPSAMDPFRVVQTRNNKMLQARKKNNDKIIRQMKVRPV